MMTKGWEEAVRHGEWLELPWEKLAGLAAFPEPGAAPAQPETGSHPHLVRQWLAASSLFPEKWVNRLFSVGGIRWHEEKLALKCFPAAQVNDDPLYRRAKQSSSCGERPAVLYEDDYCLVFDKPAGMAVHGSGEVGQSRGTLDEAAARHLLACDDPLPVRHIHRLDDDTSGPVLYSKNDLAQLRLDEAMRGKEIHRRYVAVVHGRLNNRSGIIREPIGKDRHHSTRRRVSSNGDKAVTRYEMIASNSRYSLVRLELETGRTHQIRVHMSHMGHPLLGDELYGGSIDMLKHQALHGEELIFAHPLTGGKISAASPRPDWLVRLLDRIDLV